MFATTKIYHQPHWILYEESKILNPTQNLEKIRAFRILGLQELHEGMKLTFN